MNCVSYRLVWLQFAIIACTSVFGVEYEIEGNLVYRSFRANGQPLRTMHRSFFIAVHDSAWYIETRDTSPNKEIEGLVSWECGSDGVDTYQLERYDGKIREVDFAFPDKKGGVKVAKTNMAIPSALCKVVTGPIPHPWIDFSAQLWLAYGSSAYLQTNTSGRLQPVWAFGEDELLYTGFTMKAEYTLTREEPRLPVSLIYFNEGAEYTMKDGKKRFVALPAPFNREWTNAVYEAVAFTNVARLKVPTRFRVTRYAPALQGTSAADLRVSSVIEAEATVVRDRLTRGSQLPELPARVVVEDHRFYASALGPIAYTTTNGWLDVAGARKLPSFERVVKGTRIAITSGRNARNAKPNVWINSVAYFALLAVLLLPVLVLIKKRRNR